MVSEVNNLPVGFFDSGVGGLSVYARFKELLPNENTIYYGDLKNMPYGSKSRVELIGFARNILDFYEAKNVKAVVIACNTSSAVAYNEIKNYYKFKIYPVLQYCAKAVSEMGLSSVGIFATPATVNSNAYRNEILKYNSNIEVYQEACPNWTSIVESGMADYDYVKSDVGEHVCNILKYNPEKIVLGCTHYPYLMNVLTEFAPEEKYIDPAKIFVESIKNDLEKSGMLNENKIAGTEEFYVSANPNDFVKNSKIFYNIEQEPCLISEILHKTTA